MMTEQPILKDIMPLFNPIYPAAYLKNYQRLKDKMAKKEFDEEANKLAEKLLQEDQGNYNCWYVKKMCLINGSTTLEHQQMICDIILSKKLKGFQIWEQKRFLADRSKQFAAEFAMIEQKLQIDAKNYHAWSYRTWVVDQTQQYEQELHFANKLICKDIYNNSAWSYRYHLICSLLKLHNDTFKTTTIEKQIHYALEKIQKAVDNLASWNYLRGYFGSFKLDNMPNCNVFRPVLATKYCEYPLILEKCLQIIKSVQGKRIDNNCQTKLTTADKRLLQGQKQVMITLVHIYSEKEQTMQYARNISAALIHKDILRKNYWKWIGEHLQY